MRKVTLASLLKDAFEDGLDPHFVAAMSSRWVAVDKIELEEMDAVLRALVQDHLDPTTYKKRDALVLRGKAILGITSKKGGTQSEAAKPE